jgi:hypothetical protein
LACARRKETAPLGIYQITALPPVDHREPQYRIKSLAEHHERRALEFELRVVERPLEKRSVTA